MGRVKETRRHHTKTKVSYPDPFSPSSKGKTFPDAEGLALYILKAQYLKFREFLCVYTRVHLKWESGEVGTPVNFG